MSYPDWYRSVSAPFRGKTTARVLDLLDRGLVVIIAVVYVIALLKLAITADARLWKALLVPAVTFALVTVLRTALDKPRPYKLFNIQPILVKERQGKSFPSRHVSSAAVIACTMAWLNPIAGVFGLAGCAVVSATRIIGGVHFPRDVVAAIAIALACSVFGFLVLP